MSRHVCRSRLALRGIALVVGVIAVAGPGTGTALAASPRGPALPSLPSSVPWRQAGPGWAIAEYSASSTPFVPLVPGPTTLYLISPQGRKYPFYRWPATRHGLPRWQIVDWSGDRQRVLARDMTVPGGSPVSLEQISLVTGTVISRFQLPPGNGPIGYTRPDGLNLLAFRFQGAIAQYVRYNLVGQLQRVLVRATSLGNAIESADGTSLAVGTSRGLDEVSNLGALIRRIAVPVGVQGCSPVRWWDASTVLAACFATGRFGGSRLWLFPAGGGTAKPLTPQRGNGGPDFGDASAWRLTSGRYLQALGACDTQFIARQGRSGMVSVVNVHDSANSNLIVTGRGAWLLVRSVTGCPSALGTKSLLWFDPATGSVRYVIHTPLNLSGVQDVVPYGRPLA